MPAWAKNAIDAWTATAGVTEGFLFKPVNRGDQVVGDRLSEKVVWQMLKPTTKAAHLDPQELSEQTLRRRLHDCGLLVTIDRGRQTLLVRRTLEGRARNVLHLGAVI